MSDVPTRTDNGPSPVRFSLGAIAFLLVSTALLIWSIVAYLSYLGDLKEARFAFNLTPQSVPIGVAYQNLEREYSTYVVYLALAGILFVAAFVTWLLSRSRKTA